MNRRRVHESAMPLPWIFLAIGARRMQRSVADRPGLSVLPFPVGGVAALIRWFGDEAPQPPAECWRGWPAR